MGVRLFLSISEEKCPKTHNYVSKGGFSNLNGFACDAECEEIISINAHEFLPINKVIEILQHWIGKLRHGGKILFVGVDSRLVAKGFVDFKLSQEAYNVLVHGDENNTKSVLLGIGGLSEWIENNTKLKILRKKIDGYSYSVEAQRP